MDAGGAGAPNIRRTRGQSKSVPVEIHASRDEEDHAHDDLDIRPEDSASQVASVSSITSSRAKAAKLSARAKALKALQEIELQEIRCKQERERIELELQMRETEVEIEQLEASGGSRKSVSQVADGSVQFVNKSKLNPNVPAWNPAVHVSKPAGESVVENVLVEANLANGPGNGSQQLFEALQIPRVEVMTFDATR